jgi:hypothetical protein
MRARGKASFSSDSLPRHSCSTDKFGLQSRRMTFIWELANPQLRDLADGRQTIQVAQFSPKPLNAWRFPTLLPPVTC